MSKEKKQKVTGLWADFKKFICRGNIVDMSVGVIIGGAFTAIITALTNNVLKPLIDKLIALIVGKNSLSDVYTYLEKVYDADGNVDLANSIYIDWGALINAIINFLLIAIILFIIIQIFAKIGRERDALKAKALEEHYKKHPEDRPADPTAPGPSEIDILLQIRDELKAQNEKKAK